MSKAKKVAEAELPVQVGHQDPADARKWMAQQVPYRNFAAHSEMLDGLVEQWVINNRDRFRARMRAPMTRWAINLRAANGEAVWHERDDDLHVPETKKALDAKAARVEEALREFDPMFEVDSVREDIPRIHAMMIGAYTHRLMELAEFQELVQPSTRDIETCNVACIKIDWEHHVELIVERKHELRFKKGGEPYYHDERRMRRAVAKRGPKYHLVDPFWLFYDIDAKNVQDAEFIGDESEMFLHEADALARSGKFSEKALQRLKKHKGSRPEKTNGTAQDTGFPDLLRRSRSVALPTNEGMDSRGLHNASKLRAIECYGWFDFGDGFDGVTDPLGQRLTGAHRVRAMLVDNVLVRFQLNPFDKKFVPYALERIVKNGHDLAGPANFETVVQLNAQYDMVHSNLVRMLGLSVAPMVVTQNDSDLPDSLLGIQAGSVLRATGDWDVIKMPDMPAQTLGYWHSYMRREIEESSGALRVFESPQGTATETERKVQEQQRQVRATIRAISNLFRRVAEITYWMAGQFATGPEPFRVVGKAASVLGRRMVMTPDVLQADVEFRFIGADSLHTLGSRVANMRQWATTWASALPNMPEVSMPALARLDFEMAVGRAHVNEIFPNMPPPWDSMPQSEENVLILAGNEVPVSPHDDDVTHMQELVPIVTNKDTPDYIRKLALQHLLQHRESHERKQAQQKAQQAQAQERGALLEQFGGRPGIDRPPTEGGQSAQTVTPGPTQERTMGRMGRESRSTSQQQAMA